MTDEDIREDIQRGDLPPPSEGAIPPETPETPSEPEPEKDPSQSEPDTGEDIAPELRGTRAVEEARRGREEQEARRAAKEQEEDQTRESELRSAVEYAEAVRAGRASLPEGVDEEKFWESAKEVQQKLDVLEEAKQVKEGKLVVGDQLRYDQYVKAVTSPYYNPSTREFDIAGAVRAGISDPELKAMGISPSHIAAGKRALRTEKRWQQVKTKMTEMIAPKIPTATATTIAPITELSAYYIPNENKYRLVDAVRDNIDRSLLVRHFGEDKVQAAEQVARDVRLLEDYSSLQIAVATGPKEVREAAQRLYPEEYSKLWVPPREATAQQIDDYRKGEMWSSGISWSQVEDAAKRLGLFSPGGEARSWWDRLSPTDKQRVASEYYGPATAVAVMAHEVTGWAPEAGKKVLEYFAKEQPNTAPRETNDFITNLGKAVTSWREAATKNPIVKAGTDAFEFWYKGLGVATTRGPEKILDSQEAVQSWANDASNPLARAGKNVASGAYDLASTISTVIPLQVLGIATGGPSPQAFSNVAELGVGVLTWPAMLPTKIAKDPAGGIGYTAGTIATLFMSPRAILRGVRAKTLPGELPSDILSFQIDIARITKPETMSMLRSRALIEAIEYVHTGKVTEAAIIDKGQSLGKVTRAGRDIKVTDIDGTVVGHVAAMQRQLPDVMYHVTSDLTSFVEGAKAGEFTVSEGRHGQFLYLSQQPAWPFGEKAAVAVRTTVSDLKELPERFQAIKDLNARRDAVYQANARGELEPGIYPLFKSYGTPPTFEYEWVAAKGTKLYPVEGKWYAPADRTGTATTAVVHPTTGERIPTIWLATKDALAEGRGVYPLSSKYGAEVFQTIVQPLRELTKPREIKVSLFPSEGAVSPLVSAFRAVEATASEAAIRQYGKTKTNLPPGEALDMVTREKAGARVVDSIKDYQATPVRSLTEVWSEAQYIPKQLVPDLVTWTRDNGATVYGSTVNRVFLDRARQPHDADLSVTNLSNAYEGLKQLYDSAKVDYRIEKAKVGEGFEVQIKDASGNWVTSIDVRSKASHDAMFPYRLRASSPQLIEGVRVETLGDQLAQQGSALMKKGIIDDNLAVNRLKDAPGFQLGVESVMEKLLREGAKTLDETTRIREDLYRFLSDYATRLDQTLSSAAIMQALVRELGPKTERLRREAEARAKRRAEAGEEFTRAYEEELTRVLETPLTLALERLLIRGPEEEALPTVSRPGVPRALTERELLPAERTEVVSEPIVVIPREEYRAIEEERTPTEPEIVPMPEDELIRETPEEPTFYVPTEPERPSYEPVPERPYGYEETTSVTTYTPYKPPPPPPPPTLANIRNDIKEKRPPEVPLGTALWKQGLWWRIIPPPYDILKPLASRIAPIGAEVFEGTPNETLTFVGGVIPTDNISFDLGVTDGYIDVKQRRIIFTGGGLETDVGKRIPNPRQGLSVPATKVMQRQELGVPTKPRRRVRVTRVSNSTTTIAGVRT